MAVPPVPPPLEQLGPRPFSFYPAILNIEHNQWLYRRATWSEVLVENTKTNQEIWVPRRYLGEVSRIDAPVMIVGLQTELEYKAGALWPHQRRIIEMPRAVNETPRPRAADPAAAPGPVVGIRLENRAESRVGRLIVLVLASGIAACVLIVTIYRGGVLNQQFAYAPMLQTDLSLTAADDYYAVVRALGPPESERWRSDKGELQYRMLAYPKHGFSVVLMGLDRKNAYYIGALDARGRPVHTVQLPGNVNSYSLLKSLTPF